MALQATSTLAAVSSPFGGECDKPTGGSVQPVWWLMYDKPTGGGVKPVWWRMYDKPTGGGVRPVWWRTYDKPTGGGVKPVWWLWIQQARWWLCQGLCDGCISGRPQLMAESSYPLLATE